MPRLRPFAFLAAPLFLAACGPLFVWQDIDTAKGQRVVGPEFSKALHDEYIAFADPQLKKSVDLADAALYAKKAQLAGEGEEVLPVDPTARKISNGNNLRLMQDSRDAFLDLLAKGAGMQNPKLAAQAQVRFDCWVLESEELTSRPLARTCRDQFMKAGNELQKTTLPPDHNTAPMNTPAPARIFAPRAQTYTLLFDEGMTTPASGAHMLDELAEAIIREHVTAVDVTGYTDRAGSEKANRIVSQKRAEAIKQALMRRGVPASIIHARGAGETNPVVRTANGVREPMNRRVEIRLR